MKVLIVFEQTDEQKIFAIVEMNEKDYEFFKDANDYFINYSEYDDAKLLAVYTIYRALSKSPLDEDELSQFSEDELYQFSEDEKKWRGKFCDSVIDSVSDIEDIDKFIFCGLH